MPPFFLFFFVNCLHLRSISLCPDIDRGLAFVTICFNDLLDLDLVYSFLELISTLARAIDQFREGKEGEVAGVYL